MLTDKTPSLEECVAVASDTKRFIVGNGVLDRIAALFAEEFPGAAVRIVADENTMAAVGCLCRDRFAEAGIEVRDALIFPASPVLHADVAHVERIKNAFASDADATIPVSVGAGTINDLVKYAATVLAVPYFCVPTAASVDGYTSYGAALLEHGYKKTFDCAAPRVVAADAAVLAAAPAYLSSSGFGDLASKIIAGSDWIIAEAAGRGGAPDASWEPIDPTAWAMTQNMLRDYLRRSETAREGDADAVAALFEALAITGFSMQHLRSSRPVSGCEHLYSHVWEMLDLSVDGAPVTHGHKVAIGTLLATALTETIFASSEPPASRQTPPPSRIEREKEVRAAFKGMPAADDVTAIALEKLPSAADLARLHALIASEWPKLRAKVLGRLMPYAELRATLQRAGCPITAEQIGLTRADAIATARRAQMIRNRYTALDLAWDLDMMEKALAEIESSSMYLR